MGSQHPDNASIPYWHNKALVSAQKEIKELFLCFSELGIDEFMWDWEGKLVDEAVIERILSKYTEYFLEHQVGKEKFITFRLPNPRVETEFRLGRAFMVMLGAAGLAKKVGFDRPPLFEVIIPMCETAKEMIDVEEAFAEMVSLKHALFNFGKIELKHIEILPLFEQVQTIIDSDNILREYLVSHKKIFGENPEYMRPFVARSDPALNSGIVPTVVAIKIALSRYAALEKALEIPLFPIIGAACLPFRGGISPETASAFADEYQGIRTVTIQSAFRYDYPKEEVIAAVSLLQKILPEGEARTITKKDEQVLIALIPKFEQPYKPTIEKLAPEINAVAALLPKRRERVQHLGLFGYSRGVGRVSLPRAIGFTGSLYTLGIPPELIGTGRGLAKLTPKERELLEKTYIHLHDDLLRASRFVNLSVIEKRAQSSDVWNEILQDIRGVEEYIGQPVGPKTTEEKEHALLVEQIAKKREQGKEVTDQIIRAAVLRKSLG